GQRIRVDDRYRAECGVQVGPAAGLPRVRAVTSPRRCGDRVGRARRRPHREEVGKMTGPGDPAGGARGRSLRRTSRLTQQEADAVRAAVAEAAAEDGVEPIGDGPMRSLAGGEGVRHLLVNDESGRLLAYANVDAPKTPRAMVEAFVVPGERGRGIASALLHAATAEA